MNRRTRLIVSLLFIVVILMAAAITRSYVSIPNGPAVNGSGDEINKIVETDKNGYSIFSDSNGFLGIAESGRIIAAPEWTELSFAENEKCIASKTIGGQLKFGCIDFEGNVVVPLIYKSIEKKNVGDIPLYFAVSDEDGCCVVYNRELLPCFQSTWKSYKINDSELTLNDETGSYIYSSGNNELLFKSAAVTGSIYDRPYELNIYSRVLLSKLTPAMIEKMTYAAENYIEYAVGGDRSLIKDIGGDIRKFKKLFPDSDEISAKRLKAVPEIHIYTVGSDNGIPLYDVSVTIEAEIAYTNELGKADTYTSRQKAAVRFRGNSEIGLAALSGEFEAEFPEYPPIEEPTEEPTEDPSANAEAIEGASVTHLNETAETTTSVSAETTEASTAETSETSTAETSETSVVPETDSTETTTAPEAFPTEAATEYEAFETSFFNEP